MLCSNLIPKQRFNLKDDMNHHQVKLSEAHQCIHLHLRNAAGECRDILPIMQVHVTLCSQHLLYCCIARHFVPGWGGHGLHTAVILIKLSTKMHNSCEHSKAPWLPSCLQYCSLSACKQLQMLPVGFSVYTLNKHTMRYQLVWTVLCYYANFYVVQALIFR